jgi:hypothetical protein
MFQGSAFDCPSCDAYANQKWLSLFTQAGFPPVSNLDLARCANCNEPSLWFRGAMVYPVGVRSGAPASDRMPDDVLHLYNEARDVSGLSPRSAAALLRLALQVLVDGLEPGSGALNDKIGRLVKKRGLGPDVTKAMDIIRVIGNNGVHPGEIKVEEDDRLLPTLFGLVNLVVQELIVRPEEIDALFDTLPTGAREAIDRRDGS